MGKGRVFESSPLKSSENSIKSYPKNKKNESQLEAQEVMTIKRFNPFLRLKTIINFTMVLQISDKGKFAWNKVGGRRGIYPLTYSNLPTSLI